MLPNSFVVHYWQWQETCQNMFSVKTAIICSSFVLNMFVDKNYSISILCLCCNSTTMVLTHDKWQQITRSSPGFKEFVFSGPNPKFSISKIKTISSNSGLEIYDGQAVFAVKALGICSNYGHKRPAPFPFGAAVPLRYFSINIAWGNSQIKNTNKSWCHLV